MVLLTLICRYNRQLVLAIAWSFVFVIVFNSIFSILYQENDSASFVHDRSKRQAIQPDPTDEKDLFSEMELNRVSRRVLNESDSYIEEGGVKRPIPMKTLNKAYTEAKRLYYAKKNCVQRPPPAPSTAAPPATGGGGDAPPPAPPPEPTEAPAEPPADPPADPPGDGTRRRRGALELTTERVYYCDEFTTTTVAPPPTEAPAGGGDTPTEAPTESPTER